LIITHICIAYRYIRFIYNRVILENAPVRAAAVAAMAQFGATCPDLLPNVQVVTALPSVACRNVSAIDPLTLELNPSAQRCLMRFFAGDFAS
jgi:hypothetical protein